jgi:hypothetical protein
LLQVVAASPLLAAWPADVRAAQQDSPCPLPPGMGTVGVVAGQVVRVSFFHHLDQVPAPPCNVQAVLTGLDGQALGFAKGELVPGTGVFADFVLAENTRRGERVQFHAEVHVPADHPVGANLEIFEAKSGWTVFSIVPCWVPARPTTGMGTVGVAGGQRVRVSVFHHLTEVVTPCDFEAVLIGLDGKELARELGQVLPGQGSSLDLDLAAGLRKGERVQFHAEVRMPVHEDGVLPLSTSLEIYDVKTGTTLVPSPPCNIPDLSLLG